MKKTLSINLEEVYKLRIESKEDLKKSFFADVYNQAFNQVKGIIKWTDEYRNSNSDSDFKRENREYNNILAFVGERGTGKSSAMITVAQALVSDGMKHLETGYKETGYKFESIHTIDPSRFEKDQNVVEVIIAELFEKFQQKVVEKNNLSTESDIREVYTAFQNVYKCLKVISGSNSLNKFDGDALETLATLADATKMEEYMQRLIYLYLKFIHTDKAEGKSILIIPVDDFDLNVKHAGVMAEQIRKYLMIPQVLILMAINMDQLGDVKTQEVLKDFDVLLERSKMSESPRDVAARYILKLIPIERRMMIPSIRIERNNVKLFLFREKRQGYTTVLETIIAPSDTINFEEQIFNYIYDCTGLYFVSNPEEYHTFLPNTLREFLTLCFVIGSFENIEVISENDDENVIKGKEKRNSQIKCENLKLFEDYFKNTWIKDYLLIPFQKMIINSSSISYIAWNKFFITSTVEILSKEEKYKLDFSFSEIYSNDDEFKYIINRSNYASNISLGDFVYIFSFLNRVYVYDKEIKKMIFSLNCWYSIKLNTLKYNFHYQEIKDIVNGTIVNKEMGIIRDTDSKMKRIEFLFNRVQDKENIDYDFLKQNIFIKHQYNSIYRQNESYVNKVAFEDNGKIFKKPVFNLFSFVYKDNNNIFPLPYNNLELWCSILEQIDKDYKVKANDLALVSYLFKQIKDNLVEVDMLNAFLKHPIIKLFFNENGGEIYEKYDEKMPVPEWFGQVYEMRNLGSSDAIVDMKKIISKCTEMISIPKGRKSTKKLFEDVFSYLVANKVEDSKLIKFRDDLTNPESLNKPIKEFKTHLRTQLQLLRSE